MLQIVFSGIRHAYKDRSIIGRGENGMFTDTYCGGHGVTVVLPQNLFSPIVESDEPVTCMTCVAEMEG